MAMGFPPLQDAKRPRVFDLDRMIQIAHSWPEGQYEGFGWKRSLCHPTDRREASKINANSNNFDCCVHIGHTAASFRRSG